LNRIHELIKLANPDATMAVDHDGAVYSYGQLRDGVELSCGLLRTHGVRAGDRVAVLAENSVTYVVLVLALSRLDAWTVPVNPRLSNAEIDYILQAADVRCAAFTPEVSQEVQHQASRLQASSVGELFCGSLEVTECRACDCEPLNRDASQVAALVYTSGTTGQPKGVMLSHGNLIYCTGASEKTRDIATSDQLILVLPCTHIFAFSAVILTLLRCGASMIMMPRFSPAPVVDAIDRGATLMAGVPQMYAAILSYLDASNRSVKNSRVRYLTSGGAPLDPDWKRRVESAFGVRLHNGYGLTECSPTVSVTRLEAPRDDSSVGIALPGLEVKLDAVGEDGVGELLVRGPNVMLGYYQNPAATQAAITADGFLRTGDLAKIDPDGAMHIVGRLKELIVHSGFNVYPPEVEAALSELPNVSIAAVVGRARDGDEEVIAFVIPAGDADKHALRDALRDKLAGYKLPRYIILTDALPQSSSGKILKANLLDVFANELALEDQKL